MNQEQSRKKATILIVDDEEVLREIASEMLEHLGYRVQTVVSGEKAIEFVKNNPVDLLIIDMIMDPGMSGRKTFEEIIKIQPEVKAVIASGYSDSKDVEETLRLGAKCFMQKPYSLEQMESAVLKALHVEQ